MNSFLRKLIALLACVVLAACASIPLGTLWKLRGFDEQALVRLEPSDLRAAVALAPAVPVQADSVELALSLLREDEAPEEHAFGLEPADGPGPIDGTRRYSLWKLDEPGRRALASVQRTLLAAEARQGGGYTGATFSVTFRPELGDSPPEALQVSVQLLLAPEDGWLLLVDEATMPVAR